MTATTAERISTKFAGLVPGQGTFGVAADILLLKGTIVTADSDGNADTPANGQDALGVAAATYDNRTTSHIPGAGTAAAIDAEVKYGVFTFLYTGTAPEAGQVLYVVDNQTVSIDSNGGVRGIAGFCTEPPRDGQVALWMGPHVSGEIQVGADVEATADAAAAAVELLEGIEIHLPLAGFRLSSGAALPAFSNGSADGLTLADSEAFAIRFNDGAPNTTVIMTACRLPEDLDALGAVTLHLLASRVGSADTTAAFTPHVFRNREGAAYDAGSDLVTGDTAAVAGATKVVSELTKTITGAAAGDVLTVTLAVTSALDADDMLLHAAWITCTRDAVA